MSLLCIQKFNVFTTKLLIVKGMSGASAKGIFIIMENKVETENIMTDFFFHT